MQAAQANTSAILNQSGVLDRSILNQSPSPQKLDTSVYEAQLTRMSVLSTAHQNLRQSLRNSLCELEQDDANSEDSYETPCPLKLQEMDTSILLRGTDTSCCLVVDQPEMETRTTTSKQTADACAQTLIETRS